MMCCPSTYPRSRSPRLNPSRRCDVASGVLAKRTPIRGTLVACCSPAVTAAASIPKVRVTISVSARPSQGHHINICLFGGRRTLTLSGPAGEQREPPVRWSVRFDGHCLALLPAFAPKPDPQSPKDNDGQDADPEGYMDTPCRHFYSEENTKQLRKGDQPEKDRSYERGLLLHLSALSSPMVCLTLAVQPRGPQRADSRLAESRRGPRRLQRLVRRRSDRAVCSWELNCSPWPLRPVCNRDAHRMPRRLGLRPGRR